MVVRLTHLPLHGTIIEHYDIHQQLSADYSLLFKS